MKRFLLLPSCMIVMTAVILSSGSANQSRSPSDPYLPFERPGKMVRVRAGNRLSMYCVGTGAPTVVFETGFGGNAYYSWYKIRGTPKRAGTNQSLR